MGAWPGMWQGVRQDNSMRGTGWSVDVLGGAEGGGEVWQGVGRHLHENMLYIFTYCWRGIISLIVSVLFVSTPVFNIQEQKRGKRK
jgi:hypothetical protein